MSRSVNSVQLLGNLTKDPVLKYTPSGMAVINFSIATNRSYKDKQTQEWKETPEFTNVVFWGKSAEIISQYCRKGNKIFVQGRLQTRSWDDSKTGIKRYATDVVGSEFTLLTPRPQQPQQPQVQPQPQGATSQQAEEIFNPAPAQPAPAVQPVTQPVVQPTIPDKVVEEISVQNFENWMEEEEAKKEVPH